MKIYVYLVRRTIEQYIEIQAENYQEAEEMLDDEIVKLEPAFDCDYCEARFENSYEIEEENDENYDYQI